MAKKEKTSEELVMDFLTKVKNVFKKDIYIKDKLYIFAGKSSDEDIYGDIVCILDPKYKLALESFFEDSPLIYIDDIGEYKKDNSNHIHYIDDNNLYDELTSMYNKIVDTINQIDDWKQFSTKSPELLDKIFSDNASVDFKDVGEEFYITLCKKMFPLVTTKTVENLFYAFQPYIDDMNLMCLDYQFTHFRIYIIYHYLKLNT